MTQIFCVFVFLEQNIGLRIKKIVLLSNMKEIGIYVHIPFCVEKCYYCNFISFCKDEREHSRYVEHLLKEIEIYKLNDYIVTSIFIGGGTPSIIKANLIEKVIKKIKLKFSVSSNAEITIEVNPNSFDDSKAKAYKNCGINRLSFGLQTANNKILKLINRKHSKQDFLRAIKIAQNEGFDNINVDILVGLPNQKMVDVKKTINLLLKLHIPHISCYSLILEEDTPLFKFVKQGKIKLPSEEKTLKMYDYVLKRLGKNKIFRYEVSNFAKKGYESQHNLKYWSNVDYLGLGLNSHSKLDKTRFSNALNLEDYYNLIEEKKKPVVEENVLTKNEEIEEYIFLSLRKREGLSFENYYSRFGERLEQIRAKEINFLLKNNFIEIVGDNLRATDIGFNVLNEIILRLA